MADLRLNFDKMMTLDPDSVELAALVDRYEKRTHKYYEPTWITRNLGTYHRRKQTLRCGIGSLPHLDR